MFKKFNFLKYYGTKISILQWGIKIFGPKFSYLIFEAVNVWGFWGPALNGGDKKNIINILPSISRNSEVETTWISLIGWHQKTSNRYGHSSISLVFSGTATCYKKVYCTTELCPFFHQPIRYFFTTFHNGMIKTWVLKDTALNQ